MAKLRGKRHPPNSMAALDLDVDAVNNNDGGALNDDNDNNDDGQQQQLMQQEKSTAELEILEEEPAVARGGRTASQRSSRQNNHQQQNQRLQQAKQKKNSPLTDPHLQQAIEEARYEAFVDPYRGLSPFFWVADSAENGAATASAIDHNYDNDDTHGHTMMQDDDERCHRVRMWETATTNINRENMKSPWEKCSSVLNRDSAWRFQNWEEVHGVVNVDDLDDDEFCDIENSKRRNTTNEDDEQMTLLFQCGCPTVDKLAMDEFEMDHKLNNTKKKKKAGRGRKRMKILNGNDTDSSMKSDTNEDDTSILSPRLICGERSSYSKTQHPCDFNPYCLASLGGIIDHYRHCAAKISYSIKANQRPRRNASQQIYDELVATWKLNSSQYNNASSDSKPTDGGIRESFLVDVMKIQAHASRFLAEDKFTIEECMEQIKSFHRPRVFLSEEPTRSECEEDTSLRLSTPPGLRNLGATCYLNSQLQCLAQNLGFVRGLFSWIPSELETNNRMSTILSSMQSILLRMRYGPDSVIYTNDFAAALNLENGEMQDPNEFARLLFDRMAESFRRSAVIVHGSELSGLGNLLPSVFGGQINYTTKCSECGLESIRSEDFMELLMPIADCKDDEPARTNGNKASSNSSALSDVDVQRCVNSYLYPEMLEGENQYECSSCKAKRDAVRSMTFAKLPPVLNIQLARYVFDRETASKRKLTTKVLLPLSLEIPSNATTKRNKRTNYILCAVQNHLGTSAHGGHYVANVMDWTTGVWYEVNDENVSILEGGPASTFEPSENDDKKLNLRKKVNGSQDAYNLLYVERHYLAQQCKIEMRRFDESETVMEADTDSRCNCEVMTSINAQRRERYQIESELLARKKLQERRVHARLEHLLEVFQPTSQMFHSSPREIKNVWFDTKVLRRLFSCRDDLDDLFESASKSLPASNSCLCEHLRLHPRVARRGKLLPLAVYNELDLIMTRMYTMFLHDQGRGSILTHQSILSEYVFIDGENLTCIECGVSYQQETRRKLDLFTTLLSVYDDLIPGRNDLDQCEVLGSSETYVISRTWVTALRKYVEKTVNDLSKNALYETCGGIDRIDLIEVMESDATFPSFKGEDPTSKLTCQHKRCHLMHNRQCSRLIPENVWYNIIKIFPTSIPHLYECKDDFAIGNCAECYIAKEEELIFPQKLNEWKNNISQSDSLNELLRRGKAIVRSYPSEIEIALQNKPAEFSLHVLHHDDVQRWRDSFHAFGKSSRKKISMIKQELEDLLFTSSDAALSNRGWKYRTIFCEEHKMTTVDIPSPPRHGDAKQWLVDLDDANFELLHDDEHAELLNSLNLIKSILRGENDSLPLPLQMISPPVISIKLEEKGDTVVIIPCICSICDVVCSHVTSIDEEKPPKSTNDKELKPDDKMEGPMCKILVFEVENDTSIDVAASIIMVELSEENDQSSVATGRPRRSRKCRGGGRFPVVEIEMANDGNLAHLRLLLHQLKGKKLLGQRLFLLRTSPQLDDVSQSYEELGHAINEKSIHEIVFGSVSTNEDISYSAANTIHLVLSYADSNDGKRNSRRQLSPAEKSEEEALHFSLLDIAYMGWNADDSNDKSVTVSRSKQRRQERGFQGTFLQSADFDLPGSASNAQNDAESDENDVEPVYSSKQATQSADDNESLQIGVEAVPISGPIQIVNDSIEEIASDASAENVVILDENIALDEDSAHNERVDRDADASTSTPRGSARDGCTSAPYPSDMEYEQQEQQQEEQQPQSLQVLQLVNSFRAFEARIDHMEHRLGQAHQRMEHRLEQVQESTERIWKYLKKGDNLRKETMEENGAEGGIDKTMSL